MKRIEDIKEFKDIDTYYGISNIVEEVFQDRVEAHKHLIIANKEIERLNNIINELEKWLKYEINKSGFEQDYERKSCYEDIFEELQELKGSDDNA